VCIEKLGDELRVGQNRLLLLRNMCKGGFNNIETFIELRVSDHEGNKDANNIVKGSRGDSDEAVFVTILGDGLGL
jgi:hypothetical protein